MCPNKFHLVRKMSSYKCFYCQDDCWEDAGFPYEPNAVGNDGK